MEEVKVLRGQEALEVIEELLDNDFVLTPDFRLVHLPKDHVLIKKTGSCGPTTAGPFLPIEYIVDLIKDLPK